MAARARTRGGLVDAGKEGRVVSQILILQVIHKLPPRCLAQVELRHGLGGALAEEAGVE